MNFIELFDEHMQALQDSNPDIDISNLPLYNDDGREIRSAFLEKDGITGQYYIALSNEIDGDID